jgi:hypothetical protein
MDLDAAREEWDSVEEVVPEFRDGGDVRVQQPEQVQRRETALITAEAAVAHFGRKVADGSRPSVSKGRQRFSTDDGVATFLSLQTADVLARLRSRRRLKDVLLHCCLPGQPGDSTLEEMATAMALAKSKDGCCWRST